jgi:hypothetical protein
VQGRLAVGVFAKNLIRIVFEQRLDLFQVATLGRIMNLAAEGEAAPSQRNQRDGGEAGNWGMAESAKERMHVHGCSGFRYSLFVAAVLAQQFRHVRVSM